MRTYTMEELRQKNTIKYKFSSMSLNKLLKIHYKLVDVFFEVAELIDIKIIHGVRTAKEQNALYRRKRSSKDGYKRKSKHQLGLALDVLPLMTGTNMYKYSRENSLRWAYFVGLVQGVAVQHKVNIRVGWKWRTAPMDVIRRPLTSNKLIDSNHFEIMV